MNQTKTKSITAVRLAARMMLLLSMCGPLLATPVLAQETQTPAGTDTPSGDVITHQGPAGTPGLPAGQPIPAERTLPGSPPPSEGGTDASVPGGTPGTVPGMPRGATPSTDPTAWAVYSNDTYGFQVSYPPQLAIVPPNGQPQPTPLARVSFQDGSVASSVIASVAPAVFAVDVYANPASLSLSDWLAASSIGQDPNRFSTSSAAIGGLQGSMIADRVQSAPNTWYYVANGQYVYRFTPLGDIGDTMLGTVAFAPA
jgi:hypothetical protein